MGCLNVKYSDDCVGVVGYLGGFDFDCFLYRLDFFFINSGGFIEKMKKFM